MATDLTGLLATSALRNIRFSMAGAASNVANASNPGYQGVKTTLFGQNTRPVDGNPIDFPTMVQYSRNVTQGAFHYTGDPLSAMIRGKGYFKVTKPGGDSVYTRAGVFSLDNQGNLVTMDGYKVSGAGGALSIPPGTAQVEIRADGQLMADGNPLGKLDVVTFADEQAMQRAGQGYYTTDQPPTPVTKVDVVSKGHEAANINSITEMTQMAEDSAMFRILMSQIEEHGRVQEATLGTLRSS